MEDLYMDSLFYGIEDLDNEDITADYDPDPVEL